MFRSVLRGYVSQYKAINIYQKTSCQQLYICANQITLKKNDVLSQQATSHSMNRSDPRMHCICFTASIALRILEEQICLNCTSNSEGTNMDPPIQIRIQDSRFILVIFRYDPLDSFLNGDSYVSGTGLSGLRGLRLIYSH